MILAVEDSLTEAVVKKVVVEVRPDLTISHVIGKVGRGYLEKKATALNQAARGGPVLLIIDLDRPDPCPRELRDRFVSGPVSRNLLFRVAVMEIESWVMADRDAFADFLGIPAHRIPLNTDSIAQPKEFVVNLARRSRQKRIREDLVPESGSTSQFGGAFNARLVQFVATTWKHTRAVEASASLRRCVERIRTGFVP